MKKPRAQSPALSEFTAFVERGQAAQEAVDRALDAVHQLGDPLLPQHLQRHAARVREAWNAIAARNPKILSWLSRVKLVGYTEPPRAQPRPALPRRRAA